MLYSKPYATKNTLQRCRVHFSAKDFLIVFKFIVNFIHFDFCIVFNSFDIRNLIYYLFAKNLSSKVPLNLLLVKWNFENVTFIINSPQEHC